MKTKSKNVFKRVVNQVSGISNMGWIVPAQPLDPSSLHYADIMKEYSNEPNVPMHETMAISVMTSIITNKIRYFMCSAGTAIHAVNADPNRVVTKQYRPYASKHTNKKFYSELMECGINVVQYGDESQYAIFEMPPSHPLASYDKETDFSAELAEITNNSLSKGGYKTIKKKLSQLDLDAIADQELKDLEV